MPHPRRALDQSVRTDEFLHPNIQRKRGIERWAKLIKFAVQYARFDTS